MYSLFTPHSHAPGLTYYDGRGTLSAYKTHTHDPVLFRGGMALVFRNCEVTSGCGTPTMCPDRFCYPGHDGVSQGRDLTDTVEEILKLHRRVPSNVDAVYTTLVWVYDWPNMDADATTSKPHDASPSSHDLDECLLVVRQLAHDGLLTPAQAIAITATAAQHSDRGATTRRLCASVGRVGGDAVAAASLLYVSGV